MRDRVAVVTTSYPEAPGDPAGHFVQAEVGALENAGDRVRVFALRGPAFGWPGMAARLREDPLRALPAAVEMRRVARAIATEGPFDRVIAHWAVPSAWPIARACPTVELVSHGADVRLLVLLPRPLRARLIARLLKTASRWRFPSPALLGDLGRALSSAQRARLETVAMVVAPALDVTVDARMLERARAAQRELAGDRPVFVSVSRLVPSKRVDRAIALAAREGATLLVIGDGPERSRLERQTREGRAAAHFLGKLTRPEALAHIAVADALVHTSEAEGLSSVVREADALGTRVVTS